MILERARAAWGVKLDPLSPCVRNSTTRGKWRGREGLADVISIHNLFSHVTDLKRTIRVTHNCYVCSHSACTCIHTSCVELWDAESAILYGLPAYDTCGAEIQVAC